MKNSLKIFFISLIMLLFSSNVNADTNIIITFFHGEGCPHCANEKEFLDEIQNKYPNVIINEYEVWYNKENEKLMLEAKEKYGITRNGVPFTIIDNTPFLGFNTSIGNQIEEKIINYSPVKTINNNYIEFIIFKFVGYLFNPNMFFSSINLVI